MVQRTLPTLLVAVLTAALLTQSASAIVGGEPAEDGAYPWLGFLSSDYLLLGTSCGGSLVAPTVFVTAAHCVEGLAPIPIVNSLLNPFIQTLSVNLGSNQAGGGQDYAVSQIHIHPDYSTNNDIAVLILASPAPFQTIRLADSSDLGQYLPGELVTVAGWGATREGGSASSQLLEVSIPIVSDAECGAYYGSSFDGPREVCAGTDAGGQDSCQGDSGGPLMASGSDGEAILIGVVSRGEGCARPGVPGIYTEVASYGEFLGPFL